MIARAEIDANVSSKPFFFTVTPTTATSAGARQHRCQGFPDGYSSIKQLVARTDVHLASRNSSTWKTISGAISMRLRFCEACDLNLYRATMETDEGQTEVLYARTISCLRQMVLDRVEPSDNDDMQVDEQFEALLERDIAFTRQWLKVMDTKISRAAA